MHVDCCSTSHMNSYFSFIHGNMRNGWIIQVIEEDTSFLFRYDHNAAFFAFVGVFLCIHYIDCHFNIKANLDEIQKRSGIDPTVVAAAAITATTIA